MNDILKRIVETKQRELDALEAVDSRSQWLEQAQGCTRAVISMRAALEASDTGIIAEHKRMSPSRGLIRQSSDVAQVVSGYYDNGASAASVLTDTPFFGGSLADLAVARQAAPALPLLRKDFIIRHSQIAEARLAGADAVLLIAAILSREQIVSLAQYAHQLSLEVLLELHSLEEMDKWTPLADMTGVNNRDLRDFSINHELSLTMARELPDDALRVAESGLTSIDDVRRLRHQGYRGFLIGERFMTADNPPVALRQFLQ